MRYTFSIPVFNEEIMIPELHRRLSELMDRLDGDAEVIMIDDGSKDRSFELIQEIAAKDNRFRGVQFARNFGQQYATTAGLALSKGDAVIIMDADLQDPPEVVLEMAKKWQEGYDIVYGVREIREGEPYWKCRASLVFHRMMKKLTGVDIPSGVGEFRLLDRKAVNAFLSMPEHNRYVRGMLHWIGFKHTGVKFSRAERFAGDTKYSIWKTLKVARDAILSFSYFPLRLMFQLGAFFSIASILGGLIALIVRLASPAVVISNWILILLLASFIGGFQLLFLGVLGEYIGRIYDEVKQRPILIIRDLAGFGDTQGNEVRDVESGILVGRFSDRKK